MVLGPELMAVSPQVITLRSSWRQAASPSWAKGSPSEMLACCSPFHHLYLEVLASKG